jgi:hypothetical protein
MTGGNPTWYQEDEKTMMKLSGSEGADDNVQTESFSNVSSILYKVGYHASSGKMQKERNIQNGG